jgi:hypothetical protein
MTISPDIKSLGRPTFDYEEFYKDDRRERSPEVDYGVHWVFAHGPAFPRWRLSLVERTGEVYAMRLGNPTTVVLLATGIERERLDLALSGWEDEPKPSLEWAISRLAEFNPSRRTVPMFVEDTSSLWTSNDGRVEKVRGHASSVCVIAIDGVETWGFADPAMADAFIAGWDAAQETQDEQVGP